MDIKSAATQIENAVRAYLAKDPHGLYLIPERMQRPVIMMGPPGVGKTAIVSQIAESLGINFVSYSITHHTRQSALGLPYIAEATFGGKTARVSRYTMSEIIAAAYDAMERTGVAEGILFLDEINCASETLAPAMLQFLQYKTFGQHRLPSGWVIICAGNPPEYNRAAREFDPAMLDRMKRIDIEPNLDAWLEYARAHGVHPSITTYLTSKPKNFYRVRAGAGGTRIVTARGWEDLSRMLLAYRQAGLKADAALVSQYLQDKEVAEDFALYLELFSRYEDDYKVVDILDGSEDATILDRARKAPLDERLALVNLLLTSVLDTAAELDAGTHALDAVKTDLNLLEGKVTPEALASLARQATADVTTAKTDSSETRQLTLALRHVALERIRKAAARPLASAPSAAQASAQDSIRTSVQAALHDAEKNLDTRARDLAHSLDNALDFLGKAFGDGQEMLVFTTHLAVDPKVMRFLAARGSTSFVEHSRALMLHERGLDLLDQVDALAAQEPQN